MKRKIPVLRVSCDAEGNCYSVYIFSSRRELLEEYATQLLREKQLIGDVEFVKFKLIKRIKNGKRS